MLRRLVFTLAAVANLLLVDQAVKEVTLRHLRLNETRVVVDGFFQFRHVENLGCAWGMLQGHVWLLAVFACVALAVLVWKRRAIFPAGRLGLAAERLLYAGIVGNLVDRVVRGGVVDMFEFHWGDSWSFPVFNVADVYITVAAGLLLLLGFLESRREKRAKLAAKGKDAPPRDPA